MLGKLDSMPIELNIELSKKADFQHFDPLSALASCDCVCDEFWSDLSIARNTWATGGNATVGNVQSNTLYNE